MDRHMQEAFGAEAGSLAGEAAALRSARDEKGRGVLVWGNVEIAFKAGGAVAPPEAVS